MIFVYICLYMFRETNIFFFDDFLRTGEKRKVKRLVGTVLRKTLAIEEYGEKGKICPYMPVFHFYMFFDDFLRTGDKRKLKKMGWDSLEKNVGDPGIWGKMKNIPIYARISLYK